MARGLNRVPTVFELPEAAKLARCNMWLHPWVENSCQTSHKWESEAHDTEPPGRGSLPMGCNGGRRQDRSSRFSTRRSVRHAGHVG
jgi:hypothetical protein